MLIENISSYMFQLLKVPMHGPLFCTVTLRWVEQSIISMACSALFFYTSIGSQVANLIPLLSCLVIAIIRFANAEIKSVVFFVYGPFI